MKIEELQGKISALDKICKLVDQKFVSVVKNSGKCNNMLEITSEGNALKQKSEEQVDDMRKLEETLKLLKERKRISFLRRVNFILMFFQEELASLLNTGRTFTGNLGR